MKKRYLPFGYAVRDGNIVVDTEQRTIVQNIFTAYLAGNTFQQIAKSMISKGIEYHQNDAEWNKNTISRILGQTGIRQLSRKKYSGKRHKFGLPRHRRTLQHLRHFARIYNVAAVAKGCIGMEKQISGIADSAECGAHR